MKKFHPIRTAVTTGLIITMMIQPLVVAVTAQVDRSPNELTCTETITCEGCGCCEVATPDQRCCCCSDVEESSAGVPSEAEKESTAGSDQESLLGVCLCGMQIPPAHPGEKCPERVLVRHGAIPYAVADGGICARPTSLAFRASSLRDEASNSRYSQRFLCKWLI